MADQSDNDLCGSEREIIRKARPMTASMEREGFHWKNDVYFRRLPDNAVEICQTRGGQVFWKQVIPAVEWVSINESLTHEHCTEKDRNSALLITAQTKDVREFSDALVFIADLAQEELQHAKVGTGSEVALRHINRRACDMLSSQLMKRFKV